MPRGRLFGILAEEVALISLWAWVSVALNELWECFGGRILSHFPAQPLKEKKVDIASANSPTVHFDSTPTQSDTQAQLADKSLGAFLDKVPTMYLLFFADSINIFLFRFRFISHFSFLFSSFPFFHCSGDSCKVREKGESKSDS